MHAYVTTALILMFVANARGQQADTSHTRDLKEVSVIAPRASREIVPGQKLQVKELSRLNSLSVADAIRFFSGLQVKDYGGIGGLKTVDVRSMGTNQTGVFYDGIQLGNAQNGQIDLGKFSLDNMQEIALYNGQKSNIFQPAKDFASAGAIYMTAIKPAFAPGETDHFKGTIKTGSFGLFNPSILYQRKITEKIAATLSSEVITANGRYKFRYQKDKGYDTTAIRRNGDVNSQRLEAGLNGIMDKGEWSAKMYFYNSERGLPGYIANNIFRHEDRQWDRDFFIQSSFRKDLTSKYSLLLNGKYAYDYTHYYSFDSALYVDNHYYQHELYVSAAQQYSLTNWWNVAFSTDFQWNKLNADLQDFAYPTRYTTLIAAASAIYLKKFSAQASLLTTIVNETVKKKQAASPKREFTPSLILAYQLSKGITIRSFYKRIFRMPTFNDLYYTDIGNSLLKPEFATQYDAGVTWLKQYSKRKLQEAGVETDIYYNEVSQKIVAVPTVNQFRWMMMNLGFVKIKGMDVKARASWQFNKLTVNTRLTYTFQKAQDYSNPKATYYKAQIVYIPVHSGSLVLGADYQQWTANYSFLYTGERYNGVENEAENYMQPWYTSDCSIGRAIKLNHVNFQLTAQVNNLFNQYYDVVLNYPMPGRNYKFIISVKI